MQAIILDSTVKKIQAKLSGAAATTNPDYICSYADNTGALFTEGASDGALNGSTPVDIIAAPAASTRRVIKGITIFNRDSAPVVLTVYYNDNGTQRIIFTGTLAVGDTYDLSLNGLTALTSKFVGATGATGSTGATGPAGPANTLYSESDGATITFDVDANGGLQTVTLGGNRTLAVTISTNRMFTLILKQDGSGNRTVTWFSGILWAGGVAPTLSTAIGKSDIITLLRTGSGAYIGVVGGQNI